MFEEKWKLFYHTELPKITEATILIPKRAKEMPSGDAKVSKRRVKPTLLTHIGLPSSRRDQPSFNSRDSDPFLNRTIKADQASDESGGKLPDRTKAGQEPLAIPTVRVSAENERRLASLAMILVKTRRESRGFLELLEILLAHFKVLHQIYNEEKDNRPGAQFLAQQESAYEEPIPDIASIYDDLHMPVYFGVELFKAMFMKIYKIFPSFITYLESNNCCKKLCAKTFQKIVDKSRSSMTGRVSLPRNPDAHQADAGERDAFDAIAYADKRDSRNFSEQPILHANQQKVRDLFLEYVRSLGNDVMPVGQIASPTANRDMIFKVREIMKNLAWDNYDWFVDLLVHQYEQMRRRLDVPAIPTNQARLERLEVRITKANDYRPDLQSSAVVQFMKLADSHKLHHRLVKALRKRISGMEKSIIEGRRSGFSEEVKRLAHLAKLLAILNSFEDEHDVDNLLSQVDEAMAAGYALLRIPWIIAYGHHSQSTIVSESIWMRMNSLAVYFESQSEISKRDLILQLHIRSSCPIKEAVCSWQPPLPSSASQVDLSALQLLEQADTDPLIDAEQLLLPECQVYGNLLCTLKAFRKGDTLPSPTRLPVASITDTGPVGTSELKYTRKIRPIPVVQTQVEERPSTPVQPFPIEPTVTEDVNERLQKQLRHWYWWQWPDMKELVDGLVRYVVAETALIPSLNSDAERLEHMKQVITVSLPPLLPAILKSHDQSINLAVALTIEKAYNLLQSK